MSDRSKARESRRASQRKTKDSANGGRKAFNRGMFVRLLLVTLVIATVVSTAGFTAYEKLLDARLMVKNEHAGKPTLLTEENMAILIPGEGIFAQEYRTSKRVNILLMGTTEEELADTIMLASFDPTSKRVDVISIPRDTYHYRSGYGASWLKINAVFHDGPVAMAEAVHDILVGIPINYYAVLDYTGVENIVNSMNGVPLYVPMDMYYSSPAQNLLIDLKEGEQVLDGAHAVQFLRYRKGYPNGDLGRVQAQQQFIKNAAAQALGLDLPNVAKTVQENVDSDITLRAILYLAKKAKGMDPGNVTTVMLPGNNANIQGLSFYQAVDDYEIDQLMRTIYDPPKPVEEAPAEGEAAAE
ncbi:MAG: LCP family protein [Clostridiales Family XIII bacterium]|jgi:LCP family protein required for cell wall assembly|nr:LCP family protein [Clostridiales Family XIII bacterium]